MGPSSFAPTGATSCNLLSTGFAARLGIDPASRFTRGYSPWPLRACRTPNQLQGLGGTCAENMCSSGKHRTSDHVLPEMSSQNSARSLVRGKGSEGTGTPKNAQSGSQPSFT